MKPEFNEIVVFQSDELSTRIELRLEEETIWLIQQQIVELFDSSKANISKYIKHIFESGELNESATNQRMNRIKNNCEDLSKEVKQFSLQLKTHELSTDGILLFQNDETYM